MKIKKCFKCGRFKPITDFYTHPRTADGHLNKCKSCTKADTKKRRDDKMLDPDWRQKEAERHRQKGRMSYYKQKGDEVYMKQMREYRRRWEQRYPEKQRAAYIANRISPAPPNHNNHHWSYNADHYTDVIVLKTRDHYYIHRFLVYDKAGRIYKTADGDLLDSREKHERYIQSLLNARDNSNLTKL